MKKRNAFSLIELMVVCAIVLIICTISIPTFFNKTAYDMDSELSKLEAIFLYLQQRACATHQTQTAYIDVKNNMITWQRGNKKASHIITPTLQFDFLQNSYGPPARPTGPITQATTFADEKQQPCIKFFSNGIISSGSIYLVDKKHQIMGALTLGISQVSYIRRYAYQSNQWIVRH